MEATKSENRYRAASDRNQYRPTRPMTRGKKRILLQKRVFTKRREIDYFPDAHLASVSLVMKIAAGNAMKVVTGDTMKVVVGDVMKVVAGDAMKVATREARCFNSGVYVLTPTSSTIA